MNYPENLKYSKSHEWVQFAQDGTVLVGLTDFAQDSLGDLVFVDIQLDEGDEVIAGDSFADVESVKAVSEIFSPVSGKIAEINDDLLTAPQMVNEDPYGAWLIKVTDISEQEDLMDAEAYGEFCREQE